MISLTKVFVLTGCAVITCMTGSAALAQEKTSDQLYYSEPDTQLRSPSMVVQRPALQTLIKIQRNLDPFRLDATRDTQVSLKDVLEVALRNNLLIRISNEDVQQSRWRLFNAYTGFLPSPKLGYNYNRARGHIRLPLSLPGGGGQGAIPIDNPFIIAQAGIQWNVFQGGRVLFTALQNRNNLRAARWQHQSTVNDVLLESAKRYYDLLLNEAVLQIRIQAVATSEEQLKLNHALEEDGHATHLDVLQAQTQLADDRQRLIEQQVARRKAAIDLADYLNWDSSTDLEPVATIVDPVRLIDDNTSPGKLLEAAINARPELKSLREQVRAARKNVMVQAADLYPTVQLSATEFGIGETLSNSKRTVISTGATNLSPITLGGGAAGPTVTRQSRQITGLGVLGVNVQWTLPAFGLTSYTNIREAHSEVREAQLRANQEANAVLNQVRKSYFDQLSALRRTEENDVRIRSSTEELRLAQLRLQHGLGKNIDVLRAQQDLTDALVQRAQSAIEFNKAQAQLLHDIGQISRERLVATTPLSL